MSSVAWKDVVDLVKIASKSPASNTAYLILKSSHCQSTHRPALKTPNFFCLAKIAVIFIQCSLLHSNGGMQINMARSPVRIYGKISCSNLNKILRGVHVKMRLRTDFIRYIVA